MIRVYLRRRAHPLNGRPTFSLWRLVDGKLEAHGFDDADEARAYAHAHDSELVVVAEP